MTFERLWLVAVLLALPACFDPIVGSKCAEGYSECGDRCVVAGTCTVLDAATEAAPIDSGLAVDTTAVDVETVDAGENAGEDTGALDDGATGNALDATDGDTPSVLDVRKDTPSDAVDAPRTDDTPADVPIGPILDDAAVNQGLDQATEVDSAENEAGDVGCLDCVDADGT